MNGINGRLWAALWPRVSNWLDHMITMPALFSIPERISVYYSRRSWHANPFGIRKATTSGVWGMEGKVAVRAEIVESSWMPSGHRVRSILGAIRNHPERNQQIQSLTLPATLPCHPSQHCCCYFFLISQPNTCRNQEVSGGIAWGRMGWQVVTQQCLRLGNSPRPSDWTLVFELSVLIDHYFIICIFEGRCHSILRKDKASLWHPSCSFHSRTKKNLMISKSRPQNMNDHLWHLWS